MKIDYQNLIEQAHVLWKDCPVPIWGDFDAEMEKKVGVEWIDFKPAILGKSLDNFDLRIAGETWFWQVTPYQCSSFITGGVSIFILKEMAQDTGMASFFAATLGGLLLGNTLGPRYLTPAQKQFVIELLDIAFSDDDDESPWRDQFLYPQKFDYEYYIGEAQILWKECPVPVWADFDAEMDKKVGVEWIDCKAAIIEKTIDNFDLRMAPEARFWLVTPDQWASFITGGISIFILKEISQDTGRASFYAATLGGMLLRNSLGPPFLTPVQKQFVIKSLDLAYSDDEPPWRDQFLNENR